MGLRFPTLKRGAMYPAPLQRRILPATTAPWLILSADIVELTANMFWGDTPFSAAMTQAG